MSEKEPKTIDRLYLRAGAGLPPSAWREMATAEVPQSVVQHTTHTVEPFIHAEGRRVMFQVDGRNLVYRIGLDGTPSFMQHRSDAPPMGVDPGSKESLGNAARAWQEWEKING